MEDESKAPDPADGAGSPSAAAGVGGPGLEMEEGDVPPTAAAKGQELMTPSEAEDSEYEPETEPESSGEESDGDDGYMDEEEDDGDEDPPSIFLHYEPSEKYEQLDEFENDILKWVELTSADKAGTKASKAVALAAVAVLRANREEGKLRRIARKAREILDNPKGKGKGKLTLANAEKAEAAANAAEAAVSAAKAKTEAAKAAKAAAEAAAEPPPSAGAGSAAAVPVVPAIAEVGTVEPVITPAEVNVIIGNLFVEGAPVAVPSQTKYGFEILNEGPKPGDDLFFHAFHLNSLLSVLDPMSHDKIYPKNHLEFGNHYTEIINTFSRRIRTLGESVGLAEPEIVKFITKFKNLTANPPADKKAKNLMKTQVDEFLVRIGAEPTMTNTVEYVNLDLNALPDESRIVVDSLTSDYGAPLSKLRPDKKLIVQLTPFGGADPGPSGAELVRTYSRLRGEVVGLPDCSPNYGMPWAVGQIKASWGEDPAPAFDATSPLVKLEMLTIDGLIRSFVDNRGPSISKIQKVVLELMDQPLGERLVVKNYATFTLTDISGAGTPSDPRVLGFRHPILFTCTAKPTSKDGSESASDAGRFFMVFEVALLSNIPRLTFYIGNHKHQGDAGTRWISGFIENIRRVEMGIIFIHVTVEELTKGFMAAMASILTFVWHLGKYTTSLTSKGDPIPPLDKSRVEELIIKINNTLRGEVSVQLSELRRALTEKGKSLYKKAIVYGNLELKKYIDARFRSGSWQNNPYIQLLRAFVLINIMDTIKTNLLHNDIYNNPGKLLTNLNSAGILNSVYNKSEKVYEKLCNLDTAIFDSINVPYYPGSGNLGTGPIDAANASLPFFEEVLGMSSPTSNIAASYFALWVFTTSLDTAGGKGSLRGAKSDRIKRTAMIPEPQARLESLEAAHPSTIQKSIIREYIEVRKSGSKLSGKEYAWRQLIKFLKVGYDDASVVIVPVGIDMSTAERRMKDDGEEEEALGLPPLPVSPAGSPAVSRTSSGLPAPPTMGGTLKRSHQCPDCRQALADRRKRRTRRKPRHGEPKVTVEIVAL
jgi:hypothetical protein